MNIEELKRELKRTLNQYASTVQKTESTLRRAYENVRYDIRSIRERDPAARSDAEVALLYSGFHALALYRVAHALHKKKAYFPARAISQAARFLTGIEIHPAAEIGRGLFIDHGSAVVIGETAVIGDDCTIYQGVTLGGTGKHVGKRHPTLGNRVMVGAGAKVLGPFKVGDGAKIAAGAVVLSEVPDDSTAVGVPAHIIDKNNLRASTEQMDQIHIPDPVAQELCRLEVKIRALEKKLEEAEKNAPRTENETK
ncbi:MAG: serine O-acetyltransferase [Clostridia bacterium]|nr:serine O-acetyltransferase [Clostridia bacterium]